MARPPFRHGDLVGQRRVIEFLDRLVIGAMRLKAALPNILFCGPPGYGKSEIAMTISRPTGTTFRKVTASVRFPVTEFLKIFDGIKYGDVLFVDEAHALRPELQLLLCSAIEERRIPVLERTGKGIPHITSTDKPIPEFATFIATDQPDRLPHALRSRMAVTVELCPYTTAEMRAIVEMFCAAANLSVTGHAVSLLADASYSTPRAARHLVQTLRYFHPERVDPLQRADVLAFLKSSGMDETLLGEQAQLYLAALLDEEGPARPEALAARLGRRPRWMKETERHLLEKGLLKFAPNGRVLTAEGRKQALRIRREREECDVEDQGDDLDADGPAGAPVAVAAKGTPASERTEEYPEGVAS